jgi:DNA-binding transcriptional ArsR family regulator
MARGLRRRELGVDDLKALAHPLRQRILYQLAFAGPATSTSIAQAFGESRGAASYHLRQLERFGFIEELKERARGRERWWRLVPLDIRGLREGTKITGDTRARSTALGRMKVQRDRSLVDRYLANRHRFADWHDAAMFSSSAVHLTKKELVRFTEDYVRLLKRYIRPVARRPADAQPIAALFYAFRWPGE